MVVAFPPGALASFAVWRLAEDVRCGQVSRWSDPIIPAKDNTIGISGDDFQCLREEVVAGLAAVVVAAMQPNGSDSVGEGIQVAIMCERVGTLVGVPALKNPSNGEEREGSQREGEVMMRQALGDLAIAAEEAINRPMREQLNALPRWCSSCSNMMTPRGSSFSDAMPTTARGGRCVDVETALVAYCSALRDCLSTASPGLLRVPQRAVVALLPPHLQETATDIYAQLVCLRHLLAPTTGTGINCDMVGSHRAAAAGDVGTELLELLGRLAAQADAANASPLSPSMGEELREKGARPAHAMALLDTAVAVEECLKRHVPDAVCRRKGSSVTTRPEPEQPVVSNSSEASESSVSLAPGSLGLDTPECEAPQCRPFVEQCGLISARDSHARVESPQRLVRSASVGTPCSSPRRPRTRDTSKPLLLGGTAAQHDCVKKVAIGDVPRPSTPNRSVTRSDFAKRLEFADHIKSVAKEASKVATSVLAAKEEAWRAAHGASILPHQELPNEFGCTDPSKRVAPGEIMSLRDPPSKPTGKEAVRPVTPSGIRPVTPSASDLRRKRPGVLDPTRSVTPGGSAPIEPQRRKLGNDNSRASAPPRTSAQRRDPMKHGGGNVPSAAKLRPGMSHPEASKRSAVAESSKTAPDRHVQSSKEPFRAISSQGSHAKHEQMNKSAAKDPSVSKTPVARGCLWGDSQWLMQDVSNVEGQVDTSLTNDETCLEAVDNRNLEAAAQLQTSSCKSEPPTIHQIDLAQETIDLAKGDNLKTLCSQTVVG